MAQRLPATTTTDAPVTRPAAIARIREEGEALRRSARTYLRLFNPSRPDEDDPAPASRPDGRRSRIGVAMSRLAIGAVALLLVAIAGLFLFRVAYGDRIYPAVAVGDVSVGGLTMAQADARLQQRATELEHGLIAFEYGGKTWTPTLRELGATVDIDASLAEAHKLGRTGDTSDRLGFTRELLRSDQTVPLKTILDKGQLNTWFDKVDAAIGKPAINARIVIEDNAPKITPDATGIVVDRAVATTQILGALQRLESMRMALPTTVDQPKITKAQLEPLQGEIATGLKTPIKVVLGKESWTIDPKELVKHVTVETTLVNGKPEAHIALDVDTLSSDLNARFADLVNRKPVDAVVGWSAQKGGLISVEPSIDGLILRPKDFAIALNKNFLNGKPVEIPVVSTKPEVDSNNLGALGIEGLLGRGDSNFDGGDEARDTNIYIGAQLANHTLVRPGADYSFNGAIGAITEDKGYVVSNVIFGETPGVDIGGGICQISTTVFRAALNGGFPITEWHPHSYRILNYEYDNWGPGYDASILQLGDDPSTWGDFRFTNDTGGWLLVQTWTDFPHVIVEIYGPNMERKVSYSETWTGTSPTGGLTAGFTRTVTDAKGNVLYEREFVSPYL
ncbi:MAG TPA: VanW family protein [Thermomicrobiales bacterium]|nr:VanW family protein [Thermomicrobiales bacterium]